MDGIFINLEENIFVCFVLVTIILMIKWEKKKEMKKKEKKKKERKDLDQLPRYVHPGVPFILYIYVGYVPFIILSFWYYILFVYVFSFILHT